MKYQYLCWTGDLVKIFIDLVIFYFIIRYFVHEAKANNKTQPLTKKNRNIAKEIQKMNEKQEKKRRKLENANNNSK